MLTFQWTLVEVFFVAFLFIIVLVLYLAKRQAKSEATNEGKKGESEEEIEVETDEEETEEIGEETEEEIEQTEDEVEKESEIASEEETVAQKKIVAKTRPRELGDNVTNFVNEFVAKDIKTKGQFKKLLRVNNITVNSRDNRGVSLLHAAVDIQNERLVRLLIEGGADVNELINNECSILWKAVSLQLPRIAEMIVDSGNADMRFMKEHPRYLLHLAVKTGNLDIVKMLVAKSWDVNERSPILQTPLHVAAHDGNGEMVGWLLQNGADVNAVDKFHNTALHTVCLAECDVRHVYRLLLRNGIDVNAGNFTGDTALHLSTFSAEVTRLLLTEGGAEVNARNKLGKTPLYKAAEKAQEEVFVVLMENEADFNIADNRGFLPIYFTLVQNNTDLIELINRR